MAPTIEGQAHKEPLQKSLTTIYQEMEMDNILSTPLCYHEPNPGPFRESIKAAFYHEVLLKKIRQSNKSTMDRTRQIYRQYMQMSFCIIRPKVESDIQYYINNICTLYAIPSPRGRLPQHFEKLVLWWILEAAGRALRKLGYNEDDYDNDDQALVPRLLDITNRLKLDADKILREVGTGHKEIRSGEWVDYWAWEEAIATHQMFLSRL